MAVAAGACTQSADAASPPGRAVPGGGRRRRGAHCDGVVTALHLDLERVYADTTLKMKDVALDLMYCAWLRGGSVATSIAYQRSAACSLHQSSIRSPRASRSEPSVSLCRRVGTPTPSRAFSAARTTQTCRTHGITTRKCTSALETMRAWRERVRRSSSASLRQSEAAAGRISQSRRSGGASEGRPDLGVTDRHCWSAFSPG